MKEVFEALPLYGQIIFTLVLVGVGLVSAILGLRDRKKQPDYHYPGLQPPAHSDSQIPLWLMMGPVHDGLQDLGDLAEEHRKTNTLLVDIVKHVDRFNLGQEYTHRLLEEILREKELNPLVPPNPYKKQGR